MNVNKALLGEIKPLRRLAQFTNADKGEALTWAHHLLTLNRHRLSATSFLTDTQHIMFFRVCRGPEGQMYYSWTDVVGLYKEVKEGTRNRQGTVRRPDSGFNWLKAFLATDPLGMKVTFF